MDRITIYPTDVHPNQAIARRGVQAAANALDVECDCRQSYVWLVWLKPSDRASFLEFAQEEAENAH